jgi:hypothetical protein
MLGVNYANFLPDWNIILTVKALKNTPFLTLYNFNPLVAKLFSAT